MSLLAPCIWKSTLSVAASLQRSSVSHPLLARVLNGKSAVSPEMSLRLSKVLGRTPESWLTMQANYDLGKIRSKVDLSGVTPVGTDCPVV
ncbi:HigA family addiction module antitoxin [Maridesulfovibrio ferrireducens]|uniref:HigA family addiction module antitoxin n=1 Tax=Maridesulfovibrio ferrireducens TaxID=246191 RepID=UPI00244ED90A|nr:HigA family addiction module antitoxin [Maridesulfovibrio ferrireducens]